MFISSLMLQPSTQTGVDGENMETNNLQVGNQTFYL